MPKLLTSQVLRIGGSGQYITLAGAQPALGPTPSTSSGSTIITDNVGNTTYSNVLGDIIFSSGSLISSVLDQNISINTIGTGSFVINAPTQFNSSIQFNTSATFITANITGDVGSTSTTTGALVVTKGVGIGENLTLGGDLIFANALGSIRAQQVRVLGTATSTSTTTGAMTIAGGVGVGGDMVLGGNLIFTNAQGSLTAQQIVVSGKTNSFSTDTGALVVYGGVGVGGSINASSIFDNNTRVISQVVAGVGLSGGGVGPGVILTNTGVLSLTAGTSTHVSQNTGNIVVWVDPAAGAQTLQSVTNYGNSTTNIVYFNTSTDATSSTAAGVVIAGGLGVVKNVIISGDLTARDIRTRYVDTDLFQTRGNANIYHLDISSPESSTSSLTSNALYVNGGIGVQQNLTVGGNGVIYGNLTVLGTLTTISSSIADVGRKVVALSTSAGPSFLSIDSGITVGPISSPFVKFLFDGNSSWKSTGNFIPATSGGYNLGSSTFPWGTLYSNNAQILSNSNSVSTTTGALTVVGGLGVGGTIYAGTIYSNGQVVSPGVANTSSGIAGGQAGSIPIQYAANRTTFIPIGGPNTLLVFNGTTATWVTTSSLGIGTGVNGIGAGTDTSVSTSTGNVIVWNNSTLQSVSNRGAITNNIISLTNNTQATSTSTGSLIVVGGVGIGRNLYVGGSIYSQGSAVVTAATLNTYGVSRISAGTDTAVSTATGDVVVWSTSTLQTVTDRGNVTYNNISILNPTSSTYNGLGALTVAGGVSIGGSAYAKAIYDDRNRVVTSIIPVAGLGISITNIVTTGTTATFKIQSTGVVTIAGTGTIGVSTDSSGTVTLTNLGVTSLIAGTDTAVSSDTGTVTVWNTSTLQSITDRGAYTGNVIYFENSSSSTSSVTGAVVISGGIGIAKDLYIDGKIYSTNQTDSASTDTGAVILVGGLGVAKTIHSKLLVVESDFSNISNTSSNAIYTKGGIGADGSGRFGGPVEIDGFVNINNVATILNTTPASTSNSGALRVSDGGAYIGKNLVVMGDSYIQGNSVFVGQVTVIGTSTFIYSTNTVYTDNIVELHAPSSSGTWSLNDGKDIGLKFHYYDTRDNNGFLGRNNSTGYLDWISSGTETLNSFIGTYGTFRTGAIKLVSGLTATNTSSGDLTVAGGVGIGGSLYVGGTIFGTIVGSILGTATSATNITNGTAGQIPYQASPGATAFFGPGSAGQLLMSSGTNAPLYISTGSLYVGRSELSTFATSSTHLINGGAGQLVYQISAGQTGFVGTGTTGQLLMSSGTNAPLYISTGSLYVGRSELSTYASTATNITGGVAGQLLYQLATGATDYVNVGAGGQILMSFGSSSPTFVNTSTLYVGLSDTANLSTTATNVGGGNSGALPYQLDNGVTAFLPIGSLGYVLTSDGTGPIWSPSTGGGGGGGGGGSGTTNILSSTSTVSVNNFYIPFLSTSSFDSYVYADPGLRYTPSTHSITSTGSMFASSLYDGTRRVVTSVRATGGAGIAISSLVSTGTSTSFTIENFGVASLLGGTDTVVSSNTGTVTVWNASTLQSVTDRGFTTTNIISIANSTPATSTNTGALKVAGGVGIGGAAYIGTSSYIAGAVIITSATIASYAASFLGGTVPFAVSITSSTQATSTSTGSLVVSGGVGIGGNLYVGNTLTVLSTLSSTSSVSQNALYIAGGVGIAGSLLVTGPAVFQNNVTFSGTSTYVYSTNTVYTDNIIELHSPGPSTSTWSVDDGKDIGFKFHYFTSGADQNGALILANDSKNLEWYSRGVESTGSNTVFTSATYGTFKTGSIILANTTATTTTATGALVVAGGIGVGGDVRVAGSVYIDGSLSVTTSTIGSYAVALLVAGTDTVVTTSTGNVTIYSTATLQSISDRNSTITNALTILNDTASTSTNTGALVISGGIGIGGAATAGQGFLTNNTLIASYTSPAISSTSTQNVDSWSTSSYRTAKYVIQVTDTGFSPPRIHASELLVMHDSEGNVYKNEYGITTSVGELGTFNALVSGNNVQVQFTPSFPALTPSNLIIKMSRITITL